MFGKRLGIAALFCAVAVPGASLAQQLSQADYTTAQAESGAQLYQQNCSVCHLADLQGSFEAPNLADANFRSTWQNRNVGELQDLLNRTMPPQAPGSLSNEQYLDLIAFLLQSNAIAPSENPLVAVNGSVVFLNEEAAMSSGGVQRTPVPGRAGTIPSPHTRDSIPETAMIYQSERARTRSFVSPSRFRNVSDAELVNPDPADWTYWRRSPSSQGYSPLDQITRDNVGDLTLAWVWGMENGRSQPAPLVRDGVIFIPNFGNVVQALDGASGDLLWEYRRQFPEGGRQGGNLRTLAMWEDQIFVATTDAHLVALDARTGAVRWDSEIAAEELHGDDAEINDHKRARSKSGVRSRSTSRVAPRDVAGMPKNSEVRQKIEKLRKKQQLVGIGRRARKGEGDRTHLNMKPKWLLSGKSGLGTRDWR